MKNIKGYTLVEVAIVMLIMSIMSIVIKGTYDVSVEKSKWTEPYTFVSKVIDAQKEFHVLNDKFAPNFDELNLSFEGDKATDGITIDTKYFRYKVEAAENVCKILVARVLGKDSTDVTIVLTYADKDQEGHPGNTFYTSKGEIRNTASFKSKTAVKELEKLANSYDNKMW